LISFKVQKLIYDPKRRNRKYRKINCVNEADAGYYVIKKERKAATIKQPIMRIGIRSAMRLPIEVQEAGTLDQQR